MINEVSHGRPDRTPRDNSSPRLLCPLRCPKLTTLFISRRSQGGYFVERATRLQAFTNGLANVSKSALRFVCLSCAVRPARRALPGLRVQRVHGRVVALVGMHSGSPQLLCVLYVHSEPPCGLGRCLEVLRAKRPLLSTSRPEGEGVAHWSRPTDPSLCGRMSSRD